MASSISASNPRRSAHLRVHPQEHLAPVLRVGPARTCVQLEDRVVRVVLAGEQRPQLELSDAALEVVDLLGELCGDRVVALFDHQLVQHLGVGRARESRSSSIEMSSLSPPSSVVTARARSASSHRSGRETSSASSIRSAREGARDPDTPQPRSAATEDPQARPWRRAAAQCPAPACLVRAVAGDCMPGSTSGRAEPLIKLRSALNAAMTELEFLAAPAPTGLVATDLVGRRLQ